MGCQAVLAYAWMRPGREEVISQPGFDHPPPNKALEANETCYAAEAEHHSLRYTTPPNKVYCWEHEGHAYSTAPEPMYPFHPIYPFEFVKCHARVEEVELWRRLIF